MTLNNLKYMIMFLIFIILIACTGGESVDVDTTKPARPKMVPNLGNTGDGVGYDLDGNEIVLNDNNNGIDAVPTSDFIKIQWMPLIEDNDLNYLRVFRFSEVDTTKVLVDSVKATPTETIYIDQTLNQGGNTAIGTEWFYYIQLFDLAGNYAFSDTVSYELIQKPILVYPADNETLHAPQNIYWKWKNPSGVTHVRFLLFNSNEDLIWNKDIYVTLEDGDSLMYDGEYNISSYFDGEWRVDAFVDGAQNKGSESQQRKIFIRSF